MYPQAIQLNRGSNIQLNAEPNAITLVSGKDSISIMANQITMSDGNNYTGFTGSQRYVTEVGQFNIRTYKTLYFKNGICYNIS